MYSHLVQDNQGVPFAVQALGETDYNDITIALGVNANQGEQITFSITNNALPSTVNVYLEDNVSNTVTLLNNGDYILTPNTNLNGTGRFFLRFADSALSNPANTLDNISIYQNNEDRTIVISGQLLEQTTANIYDIQGRLITSSVLDRAKVSQIIDVNSLNTGIYIVKIENLKQSKTQKLILR